MPSTEENKRRWDGVYNWTLAGDEWSAEWGGPFMQWYGSIFPRVKAHLPTGRILEIACGFGRWTDFLKDLCRELVVVDLSEECVESCKKRFASESHIQYYVNDGKSLHMIAEESIDFIYSFDSLVHADIGVLEGYLSQFSRILARNGVAFIHHSNLGEYHALYKKIGKIPKLKGLLARMGVLEKNITWRDWSVDASKIESIAQKHGLRCISQEMICWRTKKTFNDCMTMLVRADSSLTTSNRKLRNPNFMREAADLVALSRLYSPEAKVANPKS
jgi:ubiquinone/menaquinone biosynthesis C-methylase UbiE